MVHAPESIVSRRLRAVAARALVLLVLLPSARAEGQTAALRRAENLRAEPNGTVLGELEAGSEWAVVASRERWIQVEIEGWVWIRSLQRTDRDGYDLVVVPEDGGDGENLRSRPGGAVLARLETGALLDEVERSPGWIRVRRRAWVWAASTRVEEAAPAPAAPETAAPSTPAPAAPALPPLRVGPAGAPVLAAPDGDTLARARPGADLEVLARQGSWARVRIDGWVWLPDTTVAAAPAGEPTGPATPSAVAADPERWRGRIVRWDLQFISLERAEAVRTDFYEGEPFLLTRTLEGAGRATYVYVAVPPDRLDEARSLTPLDRISVSGRIRVGASALTGTPILDLVELRRARRPSPGSAGAKPPEG